jgi:hypothetical protein
VHTLRRNSIAYYNIKAGIMPSAINIRTGHNTTDTDIKQYIKNVPNGEVKLGYKTREEYETVYSTMNNYGKDSRYFVRLLAKNDNSATFGETFGTSYLQQEIDKDVGDCPSRLTKILHSIASTNAALTCKASTLSARDKDGKVVTVTVGPFEGRGQLSVRMVQGHKLELFGFISEGLKGTQITKDAILTVEETNTKSLLLKNATFYTMPPIVAEYACRGNKFEFTDPSVLYYNNCRYHLDKLNRK